MSTTEAGPSSAGPSTSSSAAPEHRLPTTHFYSVEFPGNVKEDSIPRAIHHLGGQARLNRAFKRNASKFDSLLELNWRPENPFSHPVPGPVVNTDSILVKVTKKRRKRKDGSESEFQGEMVVEAVGVVPKTVRFRSMADFQYQPDMSDPMVQLRSAMDRMDVTAIKDFRLQDYKEDFGLTEIDARFPVESSTGLPTHPPIHSPLRLIPPPVFSRQVVPHIYNYKANNMSIATTIVDSEMNTEKKRLINKMRWKGYGPHTISFNEKKVPDVAPPAVLADRDLADKTILEKLKKLADERPIWTRTALFNMFKPSDVREIVNSKIILPLLFYAFTDGPWRDTVVKLGYDPRTDPAARFYQRLYFRDVNHPVARPSVVDRRQESRELSEKNALAAASAVANEPGDGPPSHIFDGVHASSETAAFQLCDITDPMLKEMIEDEDGVRDECNERDGWYTTHCIERIKDVLRYKFFSLRQGYTPTQEECEALLDPDNPRHTPVKTHDRRRFQPRKHNMAKGALAPEDVAAARLRAALDSSARAASSRGR